MRYIRIECIINKNGVNIQFNANNPADCLSEQHNPTLPSGELCPSYSIKPTLEHLHFLFDTSIRPLFFCASRSCVADCTALFLYEASRALLHLLNHHHSLLHQRYNYFWFQLDSLMMT